MAGNNWRAAQPGGAYAGQAQADAQSAIDRLEALIRKAPDGIITADAGGRILSWSLGAERMFGWTAEEAIGSPLSMLVPSRLRAAHDNGLRRATDSGDLRAGHATHALIATTRDGAEIPIRLTLTRWRDADGLTFGAVVHDCRPRARAEAEFATLVDRLCEAMESGTVTPRSKTLFLAHASHELRTPLNAILGFSQLMALEAHGALNEQYRDYVRHIMESSRNLTSIIDGMLELVRRASDPSPPPSGNLLPVRALMQSAAAMVNSITLNEKIGFAVSVPDDFDEALPISHRAEGALMHLLSAMVAGAPSGSQFELRVVANMRSNVLLELEGPLPDEAALTDQAQAPNGTCSRGAVAVGAFLAKQILAEEGMRVRGPYRHPDTSILFVGLPAAP
ncbi:PAS domain S-box protein [Roseiterribacter gracilis]|uniref:histidine kinase n=1 Tax=Roseiterribacter gracilis TaxID=2812848 RepID=A0A8S8XAU8_9PROT|nr:hypothetical protein TMPK1_06720 [Rhodospirillales bacterium TMPK1]